MSCTNWLVISTWCCPDCASSTSGVVCFYNSVHWFIMSSSWNTERIPITTVLNDGNQIQKYWMSLIIRHDALIYKENSPLIKGGNDQTEDFYSAYDDSATKATRRELTTVIVWCVLTRRYRAVLSFDSYSEQAAVHCHEQSTKIIKPWHPIQQINTY